MKILIFEYLTGGGFSNRDLPPSLAREGGLMLNALLDDFAKLSEHEIIVMLDYRLAKSHDKNVGRERFFAHLSDYKNINVIPINPTADIFSVFDDCLKSCDAAWIIAPETDNILFNFTQRVENAHKLLLSCPSFAVAKTSDKLKTFQWLAKNNILTIPTQRLSRYHNSYHFPLVIKPIDGVGCENSFMIHSQNELIKLTQEIAQPQNYIIQPFIKGDALSISAIFIHGKAQLICLNRQNIQIKNQQFKLTACEVNISVNNPSVFNNLLNKIAKLCPNLFGYIGIDLIVSDLIYVVEINPRLTSSYSGINQALGINVADFILQSMSGEMVINPVKNQTILIDIPQE